MNSVGEQLFALSIVAAWRVIGGMFLACLIGMFHTIPPEMQWYDWIGLTYIFLFIAAHAAMFEFGAMMLTSITLKSKALTALFSTATYLGSWQLWSRLIS